METNSGGSASESKRQSRKHDEPRQSQGTRKNPGFSALTASFELTDRNRGSGNVYFQGKRFLPINFIYLFGKILPEVVSRCSPHCYPQSPWGLVSSIANPEQRLSHLNHVWEIPRMANLTVWKFNTFDGAENAIAKLAELQKQHLIEIKDAAIVSWELGKKKPKTRQAVDMVTLGALDGAFWGMLFGLLFFGPIFGMAVGALAGALSGQFADYGINDD
jgi:hypothetical protein